MNVRAVIRHTHIRPCAALPRWILTLCADGMLHPAVMRQSEDPTSELAFKVLQCGDEYVVGTRVWAWRDGARCGGGDVHVMHRTF